MIDKKLTTILPRNYIFGDLRNANLRNDGFLFSWLHTYYLSQIERTLENMTNKKKHLFSGEPNPGLLCNTQTTILRTKELHIWKQEFEECVKSKDFCPGIFSKYSTLILKNMTPQKKKKNLAGNQSLRGLLCDT